MLFGGAFMSFMAVAYVPAYLEDRAVYAKERLDGLSTPSLLVLGDFLVGLPVGLYCIILVGNLLVM